MLKAIEADPSYGLPHSFVANFYLFSQQLDKAHYHANECIRLIPDYALCYVTLSWYYNILGNSEKEWEYISKAKEVDPRSSEIDSVYESVKNYYGKWNKAPE